MRIVHISKVTGIAGSERHLIQLLPGLQAQGHHACLIMLEDPQQPVPRFRRALAEVGVEVNVIPITHHLDPAALSQLREMLRAISPDIVHTHLVHADLYGLIAAWQAGVSHAISSRHNDDAFRRHLIFKLINRALMTRTDRIITISHALADFAHTVEGIPVDKVTTIHYGYPPYDYPTDAPQQARAGLGLDDEPVIGFFGRLVHQKGVDVLLSAFRQVRDRHPEARLLIVGDGPLRADLEAQAARLTLNEGVEFTGWVYDAHRMMPACDIIVMPSRWEGFGLVTLEAMGYKRPLIVSQISALPEIVVHEQTGLHIPPDDPNTLAMALLSLLDDPARAHQMGEAGYQRLLSEFAVQKMVDATIEVYSEVMRNN